MRDSERQSLVFRCSRADWLLGDGGGAGQQVEDGRCVGTFGAVAV